MNPKSLQAIYAPSKPYKVRSTRLRKTHLGTGTGDHCLALCQSRFQCMETLTLKFYDGLGGCVMALFAAQGRQDDEPKAT